MISMDSSGDRRGSLRLDDVEVRFRGRAGGEIVVIRGLDLSVAAGEIVSVIGPNGCGKSTMLRVVGGLVAPHHGAAFIDGQHIEGPDRRVGLVFQEPRLLPWRSVSRNVAYPLELLGQSGREVRERTREQLRLVGLGDAAELMPAELSGGMRQRAALARALILEPSVLLLDEPFSALDALTRDRLNVELLQLWGRRRTTIVVVTHSIPEAIFLADRVVVLSSRPGHVVADLRVDLPRPRQLDLLDEPGISTLARTIRAHLGEAA